MKELGFVEYFINIKKFHCMPSKSNIMAGQWQADYQLNTNHFEEYNDNDFSAGYKARKINREIMIFNTVQR